MININLQNIEKFIFFDSKLKNLLPDFKGIFDNWAISYRIPELKIMAQRMLIELINKINEDHIQILTRYFKEQVKIERINSNAITHINLSIKEAEEYLNQSITKNALFAYREGEQLYLSIWR